MTKTYFDAGPSQYVGTAVGGPLDGQTIMYGDTVYNVADNSLPTWYPDKKQAREAWAELVSHSNYNFVDGVWYHDSLVENDLEDEADAL